MCVCENKSCSIPKTTEGCALDICRESQTPSILPETNLTATLEGSEFCCNL